MVLTKVLPIKKH